MNKTLLVVLSVLAVGTLSYISFTTNAIKKDVTSLSGSLTAATLSGSLTLPTTPPVATGPAVILNTTPRIAYWYGKVNQHISTTGVWTTDPDGTSGANVDRLTYCKKWFPSTTGVRDYKNENIITWRNAGNTGGPFPFTVLTTQCIQPVTITTATLAAGATGSNVSAVQTYLGKLGYRVPSESTLGANTQTAIKLFQINNSLPVNGVIDAVTMTLLNKGTAIPRIFAPPAGKTIRATVSALVAAKKNINSVTITNPSLPGEWLYLTCFNSDWTGYASAWINLTQMNGSVSRWSSPYSEVITDKSTGLTCLDWNQVN